MALSAAGITAVAVVGGVGAAGYADNHPEKQATSPSADKRPVAARHKARGRGAQVQGAAPRVRASPGAVLHGKSDDRATKRSHTSSHRPAHRSTHSAQDPAAHRTRAHAQVVHGPLAANTARETVALAEESQTNDPGHCLQWVRQLAGIPSGATTAATAWEDAEMKRPRDTTPPPGAAVYWTGGSQGYGHVAISIGHGRVRSSDAGGIGQVATVRVGWLTRNWGLRYAGWSNSINGYTIPGVPAA